ncbi:MAG: aminopeptidase P family protein [Firmicutes bacterium]|nr:aminopeptidase P family protein [Bacillota bacterium]
MTNLEKYLSLLGDEIDGLLLTSRYSRHYGAQFDIAEGVAIVTKAGCRYYTDSRYIESAENNLRGFDVRMVGKGRGYYEQLNEAIADFQVHSLGYEENYLTVAEFTGYEKHLNAALVPYSGKINHFRGAKEAWELERMRKAQEITDAAFTEVLPRLHTGMTELQAQAELIYCLYKNGAQGLSFDPIVVSGPNTSMPHGVAGERVIQDGDFLTMDFGVLYQGYCSDMTRTVAFGHVTEEMERVYNIVAAAQRVGIAASKAGVLGREVDAAARKVIADVGYGEYFGHGYGHSVGLEVHELPSVGGSAENVMVENAVASAEPGIYLPGKFGVRIEDVVVYKPGGVENLTHSPKNLIIL